MTCCCVIIQVVVLIRWIYTVSILCDGTVQYFSKEKRSWAMRGTVGGRANITRQPRRRPDKQAGRQVSMYIYTYILQVVAVSSSNNNNGSVSISRPTIRYPCSTRQVHSAGPYWQSSSSFSLRYVNEKKKNHRPYSQPMGFCVCIHYSTHRSL